MTANCEWNINEKNNQSNKKNYEGLKTGHYANCMHVSMTIECWPIFRPEVLILKSMHSNSLTQKLFSLN